MDDVGFVIRRHRLHALDLLETQVISNKSRVPKRIHCARGLLHLRHRILLPNEDRLRSTHHHLGYLRRSDDIRLPNQVRLHIMDAVSLWWPLGSHHLWLHVGILPN